MMWMSWSEIEREPERWVTLRYFDRVEARERPAYGDRHVVFPGDSDLGEMHDDDYNALDFPTGTVNHLAQWGNEKTGINEDLLRLGGWAALLYLGYQILKRL